MLHLDNNFSVLMAVYFKDSPEFLNDALLSIDKNDLSPSEIVIVRDGPLTSELDAVISKWQKKIAIKDVSLEYNLGLGAALNYGLSYCTYDLIIRADSDDINRSSRFSSIVAYINKHPNVHILSSWIEEFEFVPGDSGIIKKVPAADKIIQYSKKRSPFNHPAVAFRKKAILDVGGYGNEYLYEDYSLWLKLLANGYIGDNIQSVLVDMRFSVETVKRRGGIKYAISEIKAQQCFYRAGYITFFDFLCNVVTRFIVRLLPAELRSLLYKKIIRRTL